MTTADGLIVVTPAHNEADVLDQLAATVEAQTVPPSHWVIVDDASTDKTSDIAKALADRLDFVSVLRLDRSGPNSFANKVRAFEHGYESVAHVDHEFVAVLDADVPLPDNYYESVMAVMQADPNCGLAGGFYRLPDGKLGRASGGFVPGPAQVFRARVFRSIGGFAPLHHGGEDSVAFQQVRMRGWNAVAIEDLVFEHTRTMGSRGTSGRAGGAIATARELGRRDFSIGNAWIFELLKCTASMKHKPFVVGGLARWSGFVDASLSIERGTDDQTVRFTQHQQMRRIRRGASRLLGRGSA